MSLQDSFTPKEWLTVQFAPLWVFVAVAGADETIDRKELRALRRQLRRGVFHRERLASEVLSSLSRSLDQILQQFGEDPRRLLEGLEEASQILDEKTSPEEAEGFKRTLLHLGRQVAAASGGGFLGWGDRVSAEEKAALRLVARALAGSDNESRTSRDAAEREMNALLVWAPAPASTRGGRRWFWPGACGCSLIGLVGLALLAGLFYIGAEGPKTGVYAGDEVPSRFLDTMRELGALDADERIDYFYSAALIDIRDGFWFISDHRVVAFKGADVAQALTSVRFDEIADVQLDRETSFFVDSQITLTLTDGQIVAFPLSSDHEGDVRFLEKVRERIGSEGVIAVP